MIINSTLSSSGVTAWSKPSNWLDINTLTHAYDINLLVNDLSVGYAFVVNAVGGYTVDWGDSTITNYNTGDVCSHQYTKGAGHAAGDGTTQFKIRIYPQNNANKITVFRVNNHPWSTQHQNFAILWAKLGDTAITNSDYMFFKGGTPNIVCRKLEAIDFGTGITTIGIQATYSCGALVSVTIPSSVTSLGDSCFNSCPSLLLSTLPSTITTIGTGVLGNCAAITSFTMPSSITNVSNSTFVNCYGLQTVTLATGTTAIGSDVFNGCSNLKSIIIPSGVTTISGQLFSGCSTLRSVTILGNITSIGASAFTNCYALQSITMPNTVTSLGSGAFSGCTSLEAITLSTGITSIASNMFNGCTGLKSLTFASNTTAQKDGTTMFTNCEQLPTIDLRNVRFSKFGAYGTVGKLNKLNINVSGYSTPLVIDFANSTYSGSSPQIDISYNDMSADQINAIFTLLPSVTAKTIKITGCTGAATATQSIATAKGWTVTP